MGLHCLIVDDSAPFVKAARGLLEREGIGVVGLASNTAEALQRANELRPDLVLVDVDLGPDSGFDLVKQLDRTVRSGRGEGKPAIILISSRGEPSGRIPGKVVSVSQRYPGPDLRQC
jgi:CheY-like chemotaxis protein